MQKSANVLFINIIMLGNVRSSYPVSPAMCSATQILAGKLIFVEGGKPKDLEKNPRSQIEINQSQPTYEPRIEPESQWWEARMMTIAPTLLPKHNDVNKTVAFLCVAS